MNIQKRLENLEKVTIRDECSCPVIVKVESGGEIRRPCPACMYSVNRGEAAMRVILPKLENEHTKAIRKARDGIRRPDNVT